MFAFMFAEVEEVSSVSGAGTDMGRARLALAISSAEIVSCECSRGYGFVLNGAFGVNEEGGW